MDKLAQRPNKKRKKSVPFSSERLEKLYSDIRDDLPKSYGELIELITFHGAVGTKRAKEILPLLESNKFLIELNGSYHSKSKYLFEKIKHDLPISRDDLSPIPRGVGYADDIPDFDFILSQAVKDGYIIIDGNEVRVNDLPKESPKENSFETIVANLPEGFTPSGSPRRIKKGEYPKRKVSKRTFGELVQKTQIPDLEKYFHDNENDFPILQKDNAEHAVVGDEVEMPEPQSASMMAGLIDDLHEKGEVEVFLEDIRKFLPDYPSKILQKLNNNHFRPLKDKEFGRLLNELKDSGALVEHGNQIDLPEQLMLKQAKKKKTSSNDALVIPKEIMGVMHVFNGKAQFEPLDASLPTFPVSSQVEALDGQIVTSVMDDDLQSVMEVLSVHGTMTDDNALGKLSALSAGIPMEFPKDILEDISLDIPEASKDRKDFTHIPFITIDPVTAKDFDDAIFVQKNNRGWKVMVAIADVSHYVKPGTRLAQEFMSRGNSTYLPDHCIPMLPEELSNGVCSLKPKENRAAIVCTMHVNKDGVIEDYQFERGLIKSRARLTYDQVQESIDAVKKGKAATLPRDIWPYVKTALEVYNARLKDKKRRGALDINMAEQSISIGRGRDISLALEIGNESHGIIEELAVAANECAGEATDKADVKSMYRVHGSPKEQIYDQFRDELTALGVRVPKTGDIRNRVQKILSQAKSSSDPDMVQMLVTKMQSLASYSTEPDRHFGLGLRRYSHFTSPIRRASDLYEHMTLNEMFKMQGGYRLTDKMKDEMSKAADHFSMTERRSERAERECKGRMLAMFMRRNLSSEFEATVTQINGKKLWVLVEEEGISIKTEISAGDLPKGLYDYSNGDKVCIQPTEANEVTGVIKFRMV